MDTKVQKIGFVILFIAFLVIGAIWVWQSRYMFSSTPTPKPESTLTIPASIIPTKTGSTPPATDTEVFFTDTPAFTDTPEYIFFTPTIDSFTETPDPCEGAMIVETTTALNIRSGPGTENSLLRTVPTGTRLTVEEWLYRGSYLWLKISQPTFGYVAAWSINNPNLRYVIPVCGCESNEENPICD